MVEKKVPLQGSEEDPEAGKRLGELQKVGKGGYLEKNRRVKGG